MRAYRAGMNVLVIGAAGKMGELVVKQAVAAGHHVTAFVHDAARYEPSPDVRVVGGDASDPRIMRRAVEGQDAVIDTLGGKTPYKDTTLETTTAEVVVGAMKDRGVKRLAVVSALGVGDSVEQSGFFYEHLFLPTFLRGSTKDKTEMEAKVSASGLDYVIVRPAVLSDDAPKGHVKVFEGTDKAHKVTRADVAKFLVEQLESDTYLGRSVTIANS